MKKPNPESNKKGSGKIQKPGHQIKSDSSNNNSKDIAADGFDLSNPTHSKIVLNSFWIFLSSFLILISLNSFSQDKLMFNGYIKYLSMYYHPETELPGIDKNHLASNLLHNRLNFKWFPTNELTAAVEVRNRLFFGQMVKEFPDYKGVIDVDNGYINLSNVLASTNSWFLHSIIDRAWVDYSHGNWQVRAGRQRINWGMNLVWNPNDVFNNFSFFDFDYEERPGTDAVKIQYYTNATSTAELVYKFGENKNQRALAGKYRFSKFNYDFQLLGGWVGPDYLIGSGWSGDIRGGGFRGEISYFLPRNKNSESNENLVVSISGDYTFTNSLYVHSEVLFNSQGTSGNAGGRSFFDMDISAKKLSLAKYSIFGQASFPFTPLFLGSFSGMINPSDRSFYCGPSLSYSLSNNLELMLNGQLFFGDNGTEFGDLGQAIYGRLKWAF